MLSILVGFISDPVAQLLALVVMLIAWVLFSLVPDWQDRKRLASSKVFDDLCEAFVKYSSGSAGDIERARLEFAAEKFCKRHLNHRLVAIAFFSDSALSVLTDMSKVAGEIKFENFEFSAKRKGGGFPSRRDGERVLSAGKWFYMLFVLLLAVGYVLLVVPDFTRKSAVGLMTISSLPFVFSMILSFKASRVYRLARVGECIESNNINLTLHAEKKEEPQLC